MALSHPYRGHYMEAAFMGFVGYSSCNLMAEFVAECGPIALGGSALERAIDAATGRDEAEVQRFLDWCVRRFGTPEEIGA